MIYIYNINIYIYIYTIQFRDVFTISPSHRVAWLEVILAPATLPGFPDTYPVLQTLNIMTPGLLALQTAQDAFDTMLLGGMRVDITEEAAMAVLRQAIAFAEWSFRDRLAEFEWWQVNEPQHAAAEARASAVALEGAQDAQAEARAADWQAFGEEAMQAEAEAVVEAQAEAKAQEEAQAIQVSGIGQSQEALCPFGQSQEA